MDRLRQLPSEEYFQLPPPGFPFPPFQEEKEIHLRDYWRVIWKRRWMIVAVFLVAVVFMVVKTITTRPVYRGTATIQINIENPQIVDFKEIFTVNMWAMDYYQTQYRILESRNLARRVVQKLKLWEHPEFLPGPPSAFQRWKSGILSPLRSIVRALKSWTTGSKSGSPAQPAGSDEGVSEAERDAPYISALLSRVHIEPIKESRLVRINYQGYHPDLAGQVPNVLAEEYIQLSLDSRVTTTEQAKEWLGKQLEEMKAKVEKAEEALQEFGSKNDIISLDDKDNVTLRRLGELNDALAKAEADRMAKEALYRQVRQEKDLTSDAIPAVLENKLIQELKQNYIQLEAQYMRLSETFKPSHPEMIRLKNQMDTTQKRLALEISKVIGSIKNEYEASVRNESLLRAAFDQQRGRTLEMQQKSIQYNILKREADTNKDLYKSLLQRMKEVGVTAGYTASNIQLVDRAEVPRGPYMPNRNRNILLAAVIGLFLGVGLAFFFEHLDNTVKTPDDVEQLLRLPSFGMVPEISCERKSGRISMRTSHSTGKSYPVELVTCHSPRSLLSEAYRNIRTSILLSFSEQPPKKIVVTSPNPLEGKTTTLINTAISLSQTGARVLIVDGDLRKPRIHKILGNGNGTGLSNFLSGNAKLWSVIRRSDIQNVYYIPAGSIPPNPAELLGSTLFRDMVQALAERFDHILIDGPPVVGFADSVVLSSVVDGVMLVVTGGRTPKIALQRARDALLQVNAKILGVVINRVNIHQADYNDYYYRYQYYYGEGAPKKELPYKSARRETPSRRASAHR
jgi:succinoglycan biosynthesis transport protein ExoP